MRYRKQNDNPRNILSVLRNMGTTETSKTYIKNMGLYYNYPKPIVLMDYLISIGAGRDGIVMDFFAGSSTTAEAVYRYNMRSESFCKFIMVQISEELNPKKRGQKEAFDFCIGNNLPPHNSEVSKERIRRAGRKIAAELQGKQAKTVQKDDAQMELPVDVESEDPVSSAVNKPLDIGFRVLKVDSSCMADVYYTPDATDQAKLTGLIENIKEDRSEEDLLFQVLLDWGVDLALPIVREKVEKQDVFFVDGNALAACFAKSGKITEKLVEKMADRAPIRAVFRDAGFQNDSVRINVEQIFKQKSPGTEIRTI